MTQQDQPSSNSEKVFIYVWRGLQAAKFLAKDEVVGGTEYKYWRQMLKDTTDEQLLGGFRATENFHGYLTWSEFKSLCVQSTKREACHRPFAALPYKAMDKETLRARLAKMKQELAL